VRQIDIDSWDRREYFTNYLGKGFPYINIGASIDITKLLAFCKKNDLSSYLTLIHAAHRTANTIENFKYRIQDGMPMICDNMGLTFTYIPEGSELFINVTVDFNEDLDVFHRTTQEQIARQGTEAGFTAQRGRLDLIYYSAIPWIQYTHLVRTIGTLGVDSSPKISWGKYFEQSGRTLVPFSVQVHHGLMDGYHVGRYYEEVQCLLDEF
jgi:chloramphenicol O-acetyltransferase type A